MNHDELAQNWYSYRDAAEVLGASAPHIHTLAREGKVPFQRVGPVCLVPRAWVEAVAETARPMKRTVNPGRNRFDWDAAFEAYNAQDAA